MSLQYIVLMNKDREVLEFSRDFSHMMILNKALLPISLQLSCDTLNVETFIEWLNKRSLPALRKNVKGIYELLGVPQDSSLELLYQVKGLSLNDSYWLKVDFEDTWGKLNLFNNSFSESIAHVALTGESKRISVQERLSLTPEVTTNGTFAKCWRREADGLYLYKSDETKKGIYAEYIASLIADVLELNHVKYELTEYQGSLYTKCKNMCTEDIGRIAMDSLVDKVGFISATFERWLNVPEIAKDRDDFLKMLIFDGLIGNTDRHLGNWGFLFDTNTNEILKLHPLFDHNIAIDVSSYSDDPHIVEQPFLENLSIVEAAKKALLLLPEFKSQLYKLEQWYHSIKTQELFYRLYNREDELNYLLQLLHEITNINTIQKF